MAIFDALLKQLVADDAREFAGWLLNMEVEDVEPLTVELPATQVRVDTVFRVRRRDGQELVLHIEFQGRRSRPPMPWRMLDYMVRLIQQYRLPIHSTVLYLDRGAGSQDTGQHQHLSPDGSVVLAWTYQVVHLWLLSAEDILALGRRSLLPLVGLTPFQDSAETLPKVVAAIRLEPDPERQKVLLAHLINLMQDEEIIAMTQQLLSDEDIEDLKRFPFLWQNYQRQQQEARSEGERQQLRADILEALVVRFDPPVSEFRKVEQALAEIDDATRLGDLFRRALRAADFDTFTAELFMAD